MNRTFLFSLVFLLSSFTAFAQQQVGAEQIVGTWSGALEIGGMQLPLVLHFSTNQSGGLNANLDSPNQGAKGIPVQEVRLTQDSIYVDIRAIGGVYAGRLKGPASMEGQWKQSGQAFPMPLRKGEAAQPKRPQEPKPPYPYQEQEVKVENTAAGLTLAGTLTLPKAKGSAPAVILFTGSGQQDRDMSVLGHKPFLVLADYLTRQGFAVLRLDDRGVNKSGGSAAVATTQDFASDAQATYTYLKSRKEIDPKKIGLLGLSEGALIAAMVAAQQPDVAFVVLLAGNAVPGSDLLVAQNEAIYKAQGTPPELLQKLLHLRRTQFAIAASEKDIMAASQKIRAAEQEAKAQMSEQEKKALGLTFQSENAIVAQLSSPWMKFYLGYHPAVTLQKLKMPVLTLIGGKDLQVPASQNLPATEKALKAGGNRKYTVKELPGLNHLFQTATTGLHTEYAQLEETMAPAALDIIANWMKEAVK